VTIFIGIFIITFFLYQAQKPLYKAHINDVEVAFRADLKKAKKISIENEERIKEILYGEELKEVNLVFVNSTQNVLVKVQIIEVAFKLTIAYNVFDKNVTIKPLNVTSYELSGNEEKVIIAFVPPIFATQTKVYEKNFVIYIEGKTPKDFDMATVRFLMTALNIEV
jgi:hypothetical protein